LDAGGKTIPIVCVRVAFDGSVEKKSYFLPKHEKICTEYKKGELAEFTKVTERNQIYKYPVIHMIDDDNKPVLIWKDHSMVIMENLKPNGTMASGHAYYSVNEQGIIFGG